LEADERVRQQNNSMNQVWGMLRVFTSDRRIPMLEGGPDDQQSNGFISVYK
jgi:hypothetical protein